ncbi:hypothetical protein [Actinoplanes sp. GCM10030250]|uniref:hypothetical protein n=1 Tax=Actinoplanes sp. GCM10030250 TaxID=3273376 RepID=UPI003617D77C
MLKRLSHAVLVLIAATASGVMTSPGAAQAAATFARIDASPFVLDPSDSFQRYGDIVSRIEASGKVTSAASLSAAIDGTQDFEPVWGFGSYSTGIAASRNPVGFRWDGEDDDWNDPWRPQGITGSWDAQPNLLWENRKIAVTSWHGPHDRNNPNKNVDDFTRLTFVDHTSTSSLKFRDVLLVVPKTVDGVDTFARFNWNHGDGVVWYGNTLLVANGGRMHAFSLKHLWKMTRSEEEVGLGADGSKAPSGRWHRYVLPMVGEYFPESTPPDNGYIGCESRVKTRHCLNSISLDRRGSNRDSLVSAEFVGDDLAGGRAFRWPMDASTALPLVREDGKVHADEAFVSPIWHMQGIASDGANWFISGTCAGGSGTCVHKAAPDTSPSQQATVNRGLQNLSYQPAYNGSAPRLWGLTEGNDRFVFNISVP